MRTATISLASVEDVKKFVNTANLYDFDIDLVSGRYQVDAKSIMGIFSLDLSKPLQLEVHSDDAKADAFFTAISPFLK